MPPAQEIVWHGSQPDSPDWSNESRFVAYTHGDLYVAFNAHHLPATIHLPEGKKWGRIVDTSLPSPEDLLKIPAQVGPEYSLAPYSCLIGKLLPL